MWAYFNGKHGLTLMVEKLKTRYLSSLFVLRGQKHFTLTNQIKHDIHDKH